jgi:hypothetical protein
MLGNERPVQFGKGAMEKGCKVPRQCPTSFLEGLEAVTPPGYSAGIRKRVAMDLAGCLPYFFATLKAECVNRQSYATRIEAR